MLTAIEELTMKGRLLSDKRKQQLLKSLTLDEKRYYASKLLDEEQLTETVSNTEYGELDGEVTFGNKTYEDGLEVFVNNKY